MVDRVSVPLNIFIQMSQAAQEAGYKCPADEVHAVAEVPATSYLQTTLKVAVILGGVYWAFTQFSPAPLAEMAPTLLETGGLVPYVAPNAAKALFTLATIQNSYNGAKETLASAYETTTSFLTSVRTIVTIGVLTSFMNAGARIMGR